MTYHREKLTGRSRHRTDEAGKLILQVEVDRHSNAPTVRYWRDAKAEDLTVKNSIPEVV
ncbi:hypothetical protein [Shinella sp. DD12]|uniref:hypothetical protein n=1 Tax=Shinella sp. DD12 TaxID=1410620 RepID=UPI0003C54445|nr:hypothetical protein [Shinella sp. DD12]EYR81915.1 hypothetical protein SHLA_4c002070 [Shinella sp. DD12]